MAYRLSAATGRAAGALDYRLAPAHPFPAALDDLVTAYQSLLDRGVPASRTVLFGESAATLAPSALHVMRSQDMPRPGGAVAVSPITDLTLSSPSIDSPAGEDMLARPVLEHITAQYLDGAAPDRAPSYLDGTWRTCRPCSSWLAVTRRCWTTLAASPTRRPPPGSRRHAGHLPGHGARLPPVGAARGTTAGRDHVPGPVDGVDHGPARCRDCPEEVTAVARRRGRAGADSSAGRPPGPAHRSLVRAFTRRFRKRFRGNAIPTADRLPRR